MTTFHSNPPSETPPEGESVLLRFRHFDAVGYWNSNTESYHIETTMEMVSPVCWFHLPERESGDDAE